MEQERQRHQAAVQRRERGAAAAAAPAGGVAVGRRGGGLAQRKGVRPRVTQRHLRHEGEAAARLAWGNDAGGVRRG